MSHHRSVNSHVKESSTQEEAEFFKKITKKISFRFSMSPRGRALKKSFYQSTSMDDSTEDLRRSHRASSNVGDESRVNYKESLASARRKLQISLPRNVTHGVEVRVDLSSELGFVGLPPAWEEILKLSGIHKYSLLKDAKNTLRVLQFITEGDKELKVIPASSTSSKEATIVKQEDLTSSEFNEEDEEHPPALEKYLLKDDPTELFEDLKYIDSGATSKVYIAHFKDRPNDKVAIKIISLSKNGLKLDSLATEISYMMNLKQHQHITKCLGVYEKNREIWMVMEFMDGGKLTTILEEFSGLSESQVAAFTHEVLMGLSFLHSHNKIHRDIKSDNVLLNSKGEVKLSDLGFCASSIHKHRSQVGTPFWVINI